MPSRRKGEEKADEVVEAKAEDLEFKLILGLVF